MKKIKPKRSETHSSIDKFIRWVRDNKEAINVGAVDYYNILSQAVEFKKEEGNNLVLGYGPLSERIMFGGDTYYRCKTPIGSRKIVGKLVYIENYTEEQ